MVGLSPVSVCGTAGEDVLAKTYHAQYADSKNKGKYSTKGRDTGIWYFRQGSWTAETSKVISRDVKVMMQ